MFMLDCCGDMTVALQLQQQHAVCNATFHTFYYEFYLHSAVKSQRSLRG